MTQTLLKEIAMPEQKLQTNDEHVILLHGLGENHLIMSAIELSLRVAGFGVTNIYYPSTTAIRNMTIPRQKAKS